MDSDLLTTLIQPLPVHYDCSDYHVMLYLEGHRDYESIEAMIRENEKGEPLIRAILTHHGGMQADHINDEALAARLGAAKRKRKVCHTPIQYTRQMKRGIAGIHLAFKSYRGEDVEFYLQAVSKASTSRTGVINPGGHSKQLSLPVMYPERTTLAASKSYVKFDGIKYKTPVKVHIPLLFKGLKGYYSELFNIAVLRAGMQNISIKGIPLAAEVGEEWVYECDGIKETFRIEERSGSHLKICSSGCTVFAEISDGHLVTEKTVFCSEPASGPQSEFTIVFTPPLPSGCKGSSQKDCRYGFSMSINTHEELITGTVVTGSSNGCFTMSFLPAQPDWAAARPVNIGIKELQEGQYSIRTKISEPLTQEY